MPSDMHAKFPTYKIPYNYQFLTGRYRNCYHHIRNNSLCDFLLLLLPYVIAYKVFSWHFDLRIDPIFRKERK